MSIGRTTWLTAGVLVASLVVAVLLGRDPGADAAEPPAPAVTVRVEAFARRALPREVRAGGFLRAREDVTVSAERAGRVVALPRAEGETVARGDEVAVLDDRTAAADLAQARTALREARLDPRVPAAELAVLRAALERAEHEFGLHHPRAPIGGVVEVHHVDVGEVVVPGAPLLDLLDTEALVLDVEVDAEIVPLLAGGDAVAIEVDALGADGARTGRITRLAARASRATRRWAVEVTVAAAGGGLRPGMHAEARFALPAGTPALYLPKAIVRDREGERGVFELDRAAGTVAWRPVAVEDVPGRPVLVRVVDGAPPDGRELVVAGYAGLRPGMRVEVER